MIPIVLLKILGDLGFYYSFAGYFAVTFGARPDMLLITAAIQAAAFTLSFVLEKKGNLRYLPCAAALSVFALPGLCLAYILAVIPPAVYIFISARDRAYVPVWSSSADLISLYCKLLALFSIITITLGGVKTNVAITMPFAVITTFSTIMLTRSLRHDIDVYTSPLYQAMNGGTAAVLAVVTLLVSSEGFRSTAGKILKTIYLNTLMPLLLLFTRAMVYVFFAAGKVIKWFLNLLHVSGDEPILDEGGGAVDNLDLIDTAYDPNAHPIAKLIATILVIAAACYAAYRLFKRLFGSAAREIADSTGETEERSFSFVPRSKSESEAGSAAEKVRAQYRHYLKIYRKRNLPLARSFTSEDVRKASEKAFDPEANSGLRELYIKARYAERADKKDVEDAKEFVRIIRKSHDA